MGKKVGGAPLWIIVATMLTIWAMITTCSQKGLPRMLRFSKAPIQIEQTIKPG